VIPSRSGPSEFSGESFVQTDRTGPDRIKSANGSHSFAGAVLPGAPWAMVVFEAVVEEETPICLDSAFMHK
jgi:hypothetical protein